MSEAIIDNIIFHAFDDYSAAYGIYNDIRARLGLEGQPAIDKLNLCTCEARSRAPLDLFQSQRCYGEMELIEFRHLGSKEVYNDLGELAGPPYYYVHIDFSDELLRNLREHT